MLAAQFLIWWYGEGWRTQTRSSWQRIGHTVQAFSVPLLLGTLFSPWRRVVTNSNGSLDTKLQAIGDNLVSRAVGFTVRLAVLITAGIMVLGMSILTGIEVIAWPLIPPAILAGIVKGIV